MSLVLAVQPDRDQAARLSKVIRDTVAADLLVTATLDEALATLEIGVPDLILIPPLLSARDEARLGERLRAHGAEAAHVQTLTIPVLATAARPSIGGGMFARFRRQASAPPAESGCDPDVFAAEVQGYLDRAAAERELYARTEARTPQADVKPLPALIDFPIVEDIPEPADLPDVVQLSATAEDQHWMPLLLEEDAMPAAIESDIEPVWEIDAAIVDGTRDLGLGTRDPVDTAAPFQWRTDRVPDPGSRIPEKPLFEPPPAAAVEPAPAIAFDPTPVFTAPPVLQKPTAEKPMVAAPIFDEPLFEEPALEELPQPVMEAAAPVAPDEAIIPSTDMIPRPARLPEVLPAPGAAPMAAAPVAVGVNVSVQTSDGARVNVDVAVSVTSDGRPTVQSAQPSGGKQLQRSPRQERRPAPRPVQDEWGMFDPDQCGFSALVAKLDEVTEDERGTTRRTGTFVRVISQS